MFNLPKIPATIFVEREGVIAVQSIVNKARCLWRETLMHDVGIDGQIEYVSDQGHATGRLVLVQIKSGASYFGNATRQNIVFQPEDKHREYWEKAPLPVILILHEPKLGTIWADARTQLRSGKQHLLIPRDNLFDAAAVANVMALDGPLPLGEFQPHDILLEMLATKPPSNDLPLDVFDLFVHGLMGLTRSLYFGMNLVIDVAESVIDFYGREFGFSMGETDYEFLKTYVRFLIAYDLARVDYDSFSRSWNDQVIPYFIAPLTRKGIEVCNHISQLDKSQDIRVVQDKLFAGIDSLEARRRVPIAMAFKRELLSEARASL